MKTIAKALFAVGLIAGIIVGEAGAQEKERKVQFALTGSLLLGMRFDGEMGGLIGPGIRIDIDIAKSLMISPEATLYWYWWSVAPAVTLSYRFGHGYVGLGPMVTWATNDGQGILLLKARIGVKGGRGLLEASYTAGGRSSHTFGMPPGLFGVTVGFVF